MPRLPRLPRLPGLPGLGCLRRLRGMRRLLRALGTVPLVLISHGLKAASPYAGQNDPNTLPIAITVASAMTEPTIPTTTMSP